LPSWVAACNWVESDIEVSRHTLTNAKTGFSASKFINFYNGEPDEDKKRKITARFENAATGAEGKKVLIGFNNDPSKRPTIDDLGASDLTKEDFGAVDNLITNNIFSGHNITHPLLFGIQQEGKLGNASELKTAYEIFKNTYVTHKQKQVEEIVGYFSGVAGVDAEYKLKDVEPVGMDFDAATILQVAPKDWITDKLGIDKKYFEITQSQGAKNVINALNSLSPLVANKVLESMSEDEIRSLVNLTPKSSVLDVNGMPVVNPSTDQKLSNAALVNISGRQQQNLLRIVRLFSQGKLTKGQASIQLSAYGFTDEQINQYLGVDADPMTADEQFNDDSDEFIADMFAEYGDDRENYTILKSEVYTGQDDDFQMSFAAVSEFTEREAKILELLKKQPDLTNVQIAEALKYETKVVDDIIENLVKRDVIAAAIEGGSVIRKITERIPAQTLPEIKVLYTYEKRAGVAGPELLKTSRPFCVKMVGLSKSRMFSRQDIQKLSERLGYSVFKRAGGFWNNNGTIEFQCRHGWMKHVVIKKK
jgi:DNA-binding CsgD family transcriptional regulator